MNRFWTWLSRFWTFQNVLITLLVLAFGAFVGVLFFESVGTYISGLPGLSQKSEILKFVGIGMGGILVALQALMSYKRAKAMEDTANAQVKATEEQAKANQHTEKGQRQERMKNAIEHLGHESDSVRLGGAYELFHLAEDIKEWRQTVLDILCAHIRQTTGADEYRKKHKSKPSEEVQSLLTLLFVQDHEVFKGLHINLQGSWLNGVELRWAYLQGANLTHAYLQAASLYKAYLHGANLFEAQMHGAYLVRARLHDVSLYGVQLQGANLGIAQLRGADLFEAQLQGVNLASAQLQGAILGGVQLQGAYLVDAQICGVRCEEDTSGSFAQRMRQSIGQESDLSWVIFAGGLNQEDVDALVKDLSDEKANKLREQLQPHISQPISYELPENSGAVTGAYTEEEAEQWIVEYEEAVSEVPEDDS